MTNQIKIIIAGDFNFKLFDLFIIYSQILLSILKLKFKSVKKELRMRTEEDREIKRWKESVPDNSSSFLSGNEH